MTNRLLIISIILLNAFQFIGYSQDSLHFYLEIAVKNNPVVLQRFSEYQAALQKVPQVGGLPDPELSMGVFLSPMELVGGNQVADIRLMQMFPWFGVLKNAKDEMSLMANAKYESFRDAKLQVYYDVQRTWYNLYKIQQNIRISEKNVEVLRTIERLAVVKYKSSLTGSSNSSTSGNNSPGNSPQNNFSGSTGMSSMSGNNVNNQSAAMQGNSMGSASGSSGLIDLYTIQIEIGNLENDIELKINQQNTIVSRFNSYLNRPIQSPVSLPDTLESDTLEFSLQAVSDSMLSNNPMLGMLHYEGQSLEARKNMVSRMGYPMVGVGVNYSVINSNEMSTSSMNGKDMIMPMITLTLPIYRKKYNAMQTENELLKSATEQSYYATANSLQTEYYEAMQLYQDAGRRMILYENQSLLAKKSLDISIKSYSASVTDLADVLRIRQQTLDYELKQIEALVDHNTSIAWLNRLMASIQYP
jgi:outer membrane protein TolC